MKYTDRSVYSRSQE